VPADDLIPPTHHRVSVDDVRAAPRLLDDVIDRRGSLRVAIGTQAWPRRGDALNCAA